MKYAIIQASGSQFKVQEGDTLNIDKLDKKPKAKITFDQVLLIVDNKKVTLGKPVIKNAKVLAEVVSQFKAKKIRVAKFKAKSRYRRVKGHRQQMTKVKILKIQKT